MKFNRVFISSSLLIAVLSFCTISCTQEYDGYELAPIRSDLEISTKFSNPYSRHDAYILVQTTDLYPCFNYSITFSQDSLEDEMLIEFEKVKKPDLCWRLSGPATVEIPIDTSQTINFKMKLKRKWYTGKVENGEITLDNPGKIKLKE